MSIESGQDYNKSGLMAEDSKSFIIDGLYYYAIGHSTSELDKSYLGFVPNVVNIAFNPFLSFENLDLITMQLNTSRYGTPSEGTPYLTRIRSQHSMTMTLKTKFITSRETADTTDEPILNTFPFTYYILQDGFGNSLLVKPQFLPQDGGNYKLDLKARTNVNIDGKYMLYIDNYKGDDMGINEGCVSKTSITAPNKSSAFSQFWSNSSSQFNTQYTLAQYENTLNHNIANNQSLFSMGSNALGGNILGITGDIYNNFARADQTDFTEYKLEQMKNAQLNDYLKAPSTLTCVGNNMIFERCLQNNSMILSKFTMSTANKNKVKAFIKRYGYPYNAYTSSPCLRTRKAYNYIKFVNCNIHGSSIPQIHLVELKQIFENGITFWHLDRTNDFKNYEQDNSEVNL